MRTRRCAPSRGSGSARRSCRPDRRRRRARWTLDHIGIGPNPSDYVDGVARPAAERQSPLPFGFAFENPRSFEPLSAAETTAYDGRLLARRVFQNTSLLVAKLRTVDKEENWERDRPGFGSPGAMDRVFFSCAACHVGRVMVSGKMKFLPGMPNTEIEAQYFSKLLMLTGAALVESGFDPASTTPGEPGQHQARTRAPSAPCTRRCWTRRASGRKRCTARRRRRSRAAKIQTLAVADEFPSVMQDLIAVGVKTHFIYHVVAKNNAYKRPLPDVFEDRPGQMDAFGIASGLVAIHTRRPDNSFLEFVRRDNPKSPIFTGFSKANGLPADVPGMTEPVTDAEGRRRADLQEHPRVGAAGAGADRRQERQLGDRSLPRQLGRQSGRLVAHARVGRLGDRRPAHGERAHSRAAEPVHRQPAAAAVSVRQRRSGARARRQGAVQGELRHVPHAAQPDDLPGLEARRRSESHDGEHQRVALRTGRAGDGGLQHLRPEQPGAAGRRLVRAEGRLAGAARRVLPRHAAPRGGGHQRLQGGHAARHLGAGAVPAQRIGADARPADVPGHAPATIPARQPALRRSAGRLRMVGPTDGPIRSRTTRF